MARTYMDGAYLSGCGSFSAGGRRGVSWTHTRGWHAGVRVEARTPQGKPDSFDVYMTTGSGGSGRDVLLGTVHQTPGGPVWEPAENRMSEDAYTSAPGDSDPGNWDDEEGQDGS